MSRGPHRARAALHGSPIDPPVTGLTFVGPTVLDVAPGSTEIARALASSVSRACVDFAFVPGNAPWSADAVEALHQAGAAAFWVIGGVLWPSLDPSDPVSGLKLAARDPGALSTALDDAVSGALDMLDDAVAADADAVVVADDLAGHEGLLVPPDFVIDELAPRYATVTSVARHRRLAAVFHSDGDVRSVLHALAGAGFVALHCGGLTEEEFERTVEAARREGMSVIGGVPTSRLDRGMPAAVSVGARVGVLASGGGLLVSDDGGVTTREQFAALVAALGSARGADPVTGAEERP